MNPPIKLGLFGGPTISFPIHVGRNTLPNDSQELSSGPIKVRFSSTVAGDSKRG